MTTSDEQTNTNRLPEVYALIWKSFEPDESFNQTEFEERIPRLMEWLGALHAGGHLLACGGGGFEHHSGGLTLIRAESVEQALELAQGNPMNEIGQTELMIWDLYYADLVDTARKPNMES